MDLFCLKRLPLEFNKPHKFLKDAKKKKKSNKMCITFSFLKLSGKKEEDDDISHEKKTQKFLSTLL